MPDAVLAQLLIGAGCIMSVTVDMKVVRDVVANAVGNLFAIGGEFLEHRQQLRLEVSVVNIHEQVLVSAIFHQIAGTLGPATETAVVQMVRSAAVPRVGFVATALGLVTLVFGLGFTTTEYQSKGLWFLAAGVMALLPSWGLRTRHSRRFT